MTVCSVHYISSMEKFQETGWAKKKKSRMKNESARKKTPTQTNELYSARNINGDDILRKQQYRVVQSCFIYTRIVSLIITYNALAAAAAAATVRKHAQELRET